MTYEDPHRYQFSEADRTRYGGRFWRLPVDLVRGIEGESSRILRPCLADIWNDCRPATSVLPALAMHAFPGMERDWLKVDCQKMRRPVPPAALCGLPSWTNYSCLSQGRLAALSGLDRKSVRVALRALEGLGWVQTFAVSHRRHSGGRRIYYRLHRDLFGRIDAEGAPQRDSWWVRIGAELLYHGHWAMLPNAAERHLYLVIAALDGVRHADAFIGAAMGSAQGLSEDAVLEEVRSRSALSLADLQLFSGMSKDTVIRARRTLLTHTRRELGLTLPLVYDGLAEYRNGASWYVANPAAITRQAWPLATLNDPAPRRKPHKEQRCRAA
jgi:hypothetical protein